MLYNIFYLNGIKHLPANLIDYLTPVSLAFWIMGDGYHYNSGVALATNSFSIEDNNLLVAALNHRYGFNTYIFSDHGQPSIAFRKCDLLNLQELVKAHIHPSMLYKIGL